MTVRQVRRSASAVLPSPVLQVRLAPQWDQIELIRRFVGEVVLRSVGEGQQSRVVAVVHELLENAMKFGLVTQDINLEIRLSPSGRDFVVLVTNAAGSSRTELLRRALTRLNELSPEQGYASAM